MLGCIVSLVPADLPVAFGRDYSLSDLQVAQLHNTSLSKRAKPFDEALGKGEKLLGALLDPKHTANRWATTAQLLVRRLEHADGVEWCRELTCCRPTDGCARYQKTKRLLGMN